MAHHNNHIPRAKLGTAYRTWPRQLGKAISRAQHRYAVLGCSCEEIEGLLIFACGLLHHV